MNHFLVGTAGHVDHGKTTLIRALTGIDADRLAEEKKRGITIDIGFAFMELPNGYIVSVIDVPGHEKFIKNMLSGAGGIDFVILVVAADDGIMPQTREHFGILNLLNATDGVIALTKSDLVDDEWLGMIKSDIQDFTKNTFLENAPIIPVSSVTGTGIPELKKIITEKSLEQKNTQVSADCRLPVDRVFTVEGFGTVVTGTLIEGMITIADNVRIYPGEKTARVRKLQVHDKDVDTAYKGQRVAVNLSNVKREDLKRGNILATDKSITPTKMLDVKLSVLNDSKREIKNGTLLHFHYSTANLLTKVILINKESIMPGESAYAQLRFKEDIAIKKGDPFVLRFFSPQETIGGGVVLKEETIKFRRSKTEKILSTLESLEFGSDSDKIYEAVKAKGISQINEIRKRIVLTDDEWSHELEKLIFDEYVFYLDKKHLADKTYLSDFKTKISMFLNDFHKSNPLLKGIKKEELKGKVLTKENYPFYDALLKLTPEINLENGIVSLSTHKITFNPSQKNMYDTIEAELLNGGFSPPSVKEILNLKKKLGLEVLDAMLDEGVIISTEQDMIFHKNIITQGLNILKEFSGAFTLAEFRNKTNSSRKFTLSLLEYYDRKGFTKKVGDTRILVQK